MRAASCSGKLKRDPPRAVEFGQSDIDPPEPHFRFRGRRRFFKGFPPGRKGRIDPFGLLVMSVPVHRLFSFRSLFRRSMPGVSGSDACFPIVTGGQRGACPCRSVRQKRAPGSIPPAGRRFASSHGNAPGKHGGKLCDKQELQHHYAETPQNNQMPRKQAAHFSRGPPPQTTPPSERRGSLRPQKLPCRWPL